MDWPLEGERLPDDAELWARAIECVGPAGVLVAIRARMSAELLRRVSPDDVLQDTLLHAWRDRDRLRWQGIAAFRRWLLDIADNRIRDAAKHEGALKRGGGRLPLALHVAAAGQSSHERVDPSLRASTTPSAALHRTELAELMHAALVALPDELREIVRLRLFEELEVSEVAERVGLSLSACKSRLRKGAALYERRLRSALETRFGQKPASPSA